MSCENPYLSLVIPAYDEEKRIGRTIERFLEFFAVKSFSAEILVVDDGSSDRTVEVVKSFSTGKIPLEVISYEKNRGKGYAIKTGMLAARGEYALFADADMSTPIEMFDRFEPYMKEGMDVIIGTRKTAGAYVGRHQPFYRENMGKVFTWLSNRLLGLDTSDFTCGFKCFHQRTIEPVFGSQQISGWGYDTEIIFIARHKGFRIQEVPVSWFNDEATRVKLWKNVFTCLLELSQIHNNNRKGLYG